MADSKNGKGKTPERATPVAQPGTPQAGSLGFTGPMPSAKPQTQAQVPPPGRAAVPPAAKPAPAASQKATGATPEDQRKQASSNKPVDAASPKRRMARRRAAGPARQASRPRGSASSIGGLIHALEQKPSTRPFMLAAIASGVWLILSAILGWAMLAPELQQAPTFAAFFAKPGAISLAATMTIPVAVFWFLALLLWRAQELRLMSSAMTEVAVRLAEPDRIAEQSVASLGQSVRRQVAFMNEAVVRTLGRAGELEALVHNEVSTLEQAYGENELRIRHLINELASERDALANDSARMSEALRGIGSQVSQDIVTASQQASERLRSTGAQLNTALQEMSERTNQLTSERGNVLLSSLNSMHSKISEEVPVLIDKLGAAQGRLTKIVHGASNNLGELEAALTKRTGALETTLGDRTKHLQAVLTDYADTIDKRFIANQENLDKRLANHQQTLDISLASHHQSLDASLSEGRQHIDDSLQSHQHALDRQLLERTKALDSAFQHRLAAFDEALARSTMQIDGTVSDKANAINTAMETHARVLGETLQKQAGDLDNTLLQGITAMRSTSDTISSHSLKAIEGLADQADMLRSVSENLLSQIHSITTRFENQGQTILKAANSLESANLKVDSTLKARHKELGSLLERMSSRANEFDKVITGYSTTIEGSISDAETRAKSLSEKLARGTSDRSREALAAVQRISTQTEQKTDEVLNELRTKFDFVSKELDSQLSTLSSRFSATSDEVRSRAAKAAHELATTQAQLRKQINELPDTTKATADAMRTALEEQLRALEQLTELANRETVRRDTAPPTDATAGPPATTSLTQTVADQTQQQAASEPARRNLESVTESLTREINALNAGNQNTGRARSGRETWSLGDLLARASTDDNGSARESETPPSSEEDAAASGAPQEATSAAGLNINSIAGALDAGTAAQLWDRFRAGQRGFLGPQIYTPGGQSAFQDAERRYQSDQGFRTAVNSYLADFESMLREAEQRDPAGQLARNHLVSEMGRVYLVLAHASGRLA